MEDEMIQKKMMFIMRKAPHGTIYSYEGLEVVLITASYEQDVTMLFTDDGVYALKNNQDTSHIGIKGFMKTYFALEDYEVEKLVVDTESMKERGLSESDLIDVNLQFKSRDEIKSLMDEQDVLLPF